MSLRERTQLLQSARERIRSTQDLRVEQELILRASRQALLRSHALLTASRRCADPATSGDRTAV